MVNSDLVTSSLKMGTRTPVLSIVPGAQEEPGEMLFIDMEPLAVYGWRAPEVTVQEIFFFLPLHSSTHDKVWDLDTFSSILILLCIYFT